MDYLPYQQIAREADAMCADWESVRGVIEQVVDHRLARESESAERLLAHELPRCLAALADTYSSQECATRVEAFFREAYSLAALRRAITTRLPSFPSSSPTGPASPSQPVPAGQASGYGRRRTYREPKENDIASMIDDMLSGHSA